MATIINKPLSGTVKIPNTGKPKGRTINAQFIKGFLMCFDGFEIPLADTDSFDEVLAELQEKSIAADYKDRVYWIANKGLTDNTDAPESKVNGIGEEVYFVEKAHKFEVELENLGIVFAKQLRGFNDRKDVCVYPVFDSFIGGRYTSTGFAPFEAQLWAKQLRVGNITGDLTKYTASLTINNPKALTDILSAIEYSDSVDFAVELPCVETVTLANPTGYVVTAHVAATDENLYDNYADELAVAGAWKATDAVTGSPVIIATVTKNTTYKGWTFGYANANDVVITIADPTALAALTVGSATAGGYEAESGVTLGEQS